MESSNNAKEPSLLNGRRPSLPVIDLASLLGTSFSPRKGVDNKSEEALLQHGHGIAGADSVSHHSPQQSSESERKNQDDRPVADAITLNANVQQVVSNDGDTSHPFLSIKKRKRDAALCNYNVVSLQSEIMPINETTDLLDTHDLLQGLFFRPSEEATATRTVIGVRERPKRKLAGRDVRLMRKVAGLIIKKTSGRSKSRTLASPSKKRKITTLPLPSRASTASLSSTQSQESHTQLQDASSGQSRCGKAPAVSRTLFSPLPQHPKALVPLATRPATQKSFSPLPPPENRMSSTTKPTNSLPLPTRAAPGALPAHQSRESRYPMQGTPYGMFPAGNVPFVAEGTFVYCQLPPTMQHGPPVPYHSPYPMRFGEPPPYNLYPAPYYPPPLYHYPHVQPYPSRLSAPAKKNKKGKPKSKAKKKSSPPKKKATKSNSKAELIDPVKSKEMTETIQAVNAASDGKNDKAAETPAAISRGVTVRPSGKWQAQIYFEGQSRYLGVWDTQAAATLAYKIAREKLKDLKVQCNGKENSKELVDDAVLAARKAKAAGAAVTAARKAAFEAVTVAQKGTSEGIRWRKAVGAATIDAQNAASGGVGDHKARGAVIAA